MFNSIVVALDLASNDHRALPVARSLTELGGLPIQLLTVSPPWHVRVRSTPASSSRGRSNDPARRRPMTRLSVTPSTLEGSPSGAPLRTAGAGAPLTSRFSIDPVPPFRLDLTVWALRRRPANIVDRWDGDTYRRAVHLGGTVAEVEVRQTGPPEAARLDVSVTTAVPIDPAQAQAETSATLRRLLGVDVDLGEFYRRARMDPHLDPLVRRYRGLKPPRFPTLFECLVNAIACQQLTLTVGIVLLNRLAETYGPTGPMVSGGAGHAFPDAADLASSTPAGLRRLGLSSRKAESILQLASRVTDGGLDLAGLDTLERRDGLRVVATAGRRWTLVSRVHAAARARPARCVPGR